MENTWTEDDETIREFVVESHENLERLDRDLVELEKHPHDSALLSSVFRTFHTIKGCCSFLAFPHLEQIAHQAENLLSQLRDGKRELNPELISLILETVDATRRVLATVETTGHEGDVRFEELVGRLQQTAQAPATTAAKPETSAPPAAKTAEEKPIASPQQTAQAPAPAAAKPEIPAPPVAKTAEEKPIATPQQAAQAPAPVAEKLVDIEPGKSLKVEKQPVEVVPEGEKLQTGEIPKSESKDDKAIKAKSEADDSKPPAEEEVLRSSAAADANIRVGVVLLDKLMNLVGELVLTRNQILQTNLEREDAMLNTSYQRLNLITTELQEHVMKTRMQPIRTVWGSLPRIVRDTALSLGKQIQLKMEGADTELDRTIIEAIKDPLVHLVRNCCDHGIERPEVRLAAGKPAEGTMTLRAYHEGGQVTMEVSDDGAGIDVEKVKQKAVQNGFIRSEVAEKLSDREAVNLVFMAGVSTAASITKISGRGVGMDVVKTQIEKIGGIIDIFTRAGEGMTVKIRIPLTLAIIPGLIVTCSGERFVIPQVSLLELIQLDSETGGKHVEYVHDAPVFRRRGNLLPVVYLNEVLGLPRKAEGDARNMVVLQAEDMQFGLIVDSINDTQEIVVKPLGNQFKGLTLYAGATIMGDGMIALILDVLGIGQLAGLLRKGTERSTETKAPTASSTDEKQRLLLVKSGSFQRIAIPLSLVARLEEFPRESIEVASGGYVMQYRDRILPLVPLQSVLEPDAPLSLESMNPVPVIVFNDGDQSIGVVVDQIVDVTEDYISIRQQSRRNGLLGSAVVGKFVTDFLDLGAVIEVSKENWLHSNSKSGQKRNVLLTGRSAFSRSMLRGALEMSGCVVHEANGGEDAIHLLCSNQIDAVVALMRDHADFADSRDLMKHIPAGESPIPALAVLDSHDDRDLAKYHAAGFQECRALLDRAGIIDALERLISPGAKISAVQECTAEVAQ